MPTLNQSLRLEQRLQLTPQLLMNLKLLQIPALELETLIRAELETNPVLEEVLEQPVEATIEGENPSIPEEPDAVAPALDAEAEVDAAPAFQLNEVSTLSPVADEPELRALSNSIDSGETSLAEFLQDTGYLPPTSFDAIADPNADSDLPEPPSSISTVRLAEAILPQLRSRLGPEQYLIGEAIVDSLNEDGLLTATATELAERLGVTEKMVEDVLLVLQHLEGGGIGARNLQEVLLRQLEVLGYDRQSVEYRAVELGFELLLHKQFDSIAHMLEVSVERVQEALGHICQLDPRPGRKYGGIDPGYIDPDFSVGWAGDQLVFTANDDRIPRLRLAARYREMLIHPKGVDRDQLEFARRKYQNAAMLLKGIESRRRTLSRVMQHILSEQRGFFQQGREFLKPLSIKETGDALGIAASTISRAVQGKYVETPHAILPMRFFFTSGTDGVARHSVKDKLRRIIDAEDKRDPLSDEAIVKLLSTDNIHISRRAIAKYRGEMNIPGRHERREPYAAPPKPPVNGKPDRIGEDGELPDANDQMPAAGF